MERGHAALLFFILWVVIAFSQNGSACCTLYTVHIKATHILSWKDL